MLKLATRLIYELSSVVVKPVKRLFTKKEEEKTLLSTEIVDKVYLSLYYGSTIVTASSFYYSTYRLLGPSLNTYALACLKMAAAHPYSVGLSLILLSDFPIFLVWALRRIAPSK